jgi:hypothetical protein
MTPGGVGCNISLSATGLGGRKIPLEKMLPGAMKAEKAVIALPPRVSGRNGRERMRSMQTWEVSSSMNQAQSPHQIVYYT